MANPDALTLTFRQLLELESGLRQLDAIRENEKELVPLAFEAAVSYRLLRCAAAVAAQRAIFDQLDRQAANSVGFFEGMAANEENAFKADGYRREQAKILDTEVTIEVTKVTLEQLLLRPEEFRKSKRNPVPQSVLNKLAPIIAEQAE